jgi:hypothetical protein
MAGDVLDVHTFLLQIDLMFSKVLFRAASCVCTLLDTHLLYKVAQRAASCSVKCHRSPLHNLLHFSELLLGKVETITPTLNVVEKSVSLLSEEM